MRWTNLQQQYVGTWQNGVQVLLCTFYLTTNRFLSVWKFLSWIPGSLFSGSMDEAHTSGTWVRGKFIFSWAVSTRESLFRVRDMDKEKSALPVVQPMKESGNMTKAIQRYSFSTVNCLKYFVSYKWQCPCHTGKIHKRRWVCFWRRRRVRSNNGTVPEF